MKKNIPSSRFTGLAFSTLVFSVALFTAQAQAQTSCQCDWYGEVTPMCEHQNEGWGWENSQTCIGINTCSDQYGDGGPRGSCSSSSSPSDDTPGSGGEGSHNITVRMSGTSGEESVSLDIAGQTIQTWTLSTSMQDYTVSTDVTGELRVAFTNDADGRDVQVDYVIVNGTTFQAEDQEDNTGAYDGSCGGGSYSEMLHCNGSIGFGNPFTSPGGDSYSITVRMSGVVGDESVSLEVGDQTIETWTVATGMLDYTVTTDVTGEIRVAFTNDAGDRDVQVDYIIANGITYQAEDQRVNTGFHDGTSCGSGGYSEMLHCNGYISFGNPFDDEPSEHCALPSQFNWTSSPALIGPSQSNWASVKDPTIVQYNGLSHIYATVFDTALNSWGSVYFNFADWAQADSAPQTYMRNTTMGNAVAPQVFYFQPHGLWYQITQWGGAYSTTTDISDPSSWSAKQPLLAGEPSGSLDFWVICDDNNCYLFFSRNDGVLYMSKTSINNFPNFSGYEVVMQDNRGANHLFEAVNVYKVDGADQYLMLVEAYISGPRFFRSWTSNSLDGPWTPLADTEQNPFAGNANVTWPQGKWADGISHGELVRSGYNEKLTIDPCNLQFVYQGQAGTAPRYEEIPYRLGVLTHSD